MTDSSPRPSPGDPSASRPAARLCALLALALILLAGGLLRLPALDHVPYGLWFDEANNGRLALDVWKPGGHFKLFYLYNDGTDFPREPLFETGLCLVVRACGPSIVALRTFSALLGLLTVLLVYLFGRRWLGRAEGLAAAGVLATLRWHALFSRLSFRTLILGPWMLGLAWAALAYERRRTAARAALLGAFLGGGFYTYLAWWFLLPAALFAVVWLFAASVRTSAGRRHLAVLLLAAALVYLPMGLYAFRHPEIAFKRSAAVSVFSAGPAAAARQILKNAAQAVLMFHFWGDHVPIQNLAGPGTLAALTFKVLGLDPARDGMLIGHPALDPLQGLAFLLGLVLALRPGWRRRGLLVPLLFAWLLCGLASTVFSVTDSPNFLRTLCLTPVVALLAGLGLAGAGRWASRRWGARAGIALVALALAVSASATAWDLYGDWARRPEVWRGFRGDLTDLAQAARQAPPGVAVMIPAQLRATPTFDFQVADRTNVFPYLDWASLLGPWPPAPAPPRPRVRWVVVTAANGLLEPLLNLVPEARVIKQFTAPEGNIWAALLAIPEDRLPSPAVLAKIQQSWKADMTF